MKNNKGELLPQPYLDLARMRREQYKYFQHEKILGSAFFWEDTLEGGEFWVNVDKGETPEIPAASLAELEEWRKANCIPVENENSDDMCFHECPNCNDRCYCSAQPCSCCTQDEPDYKGLYEHRTAQFNELLAKYENQTPSRNWVAECAIAFVSTKGLGFEDAWDWAEQWAAEGKRRGHI